MRYLLYAIFALLPTAAYGASLILEPIERGGVTATRVSLAASTSTLNVIEGALFLSPGSGVSRVETGNGIIPLWIIVPEFHDGRIEFAGMIPGGFSGTAIPADGLKGAGTLFTIVGDFEVTSGNVHGYVHDGFGTRVDVPVNTIDASRSEEATDTVPPDAVRVTIEPAVGDTPALLVAIGADSGTGVARYEVSMGGGWQEFDPPMELPEKAADETIIVRIFDHAGNFREIIVQEKKSADRTHQIAIGVIALVFIMLVAWWGRSRTVR